MEQKRRNKEEMQGKEKIINNRGNQSNEEKNNEMEKEINFIQNKTIVNISAQS